MTDATPTPADARAIERIREFYSQPVGEFAQALKLANRILDDASRDPDSDISMLSRQLLRRVENVETLLTAEIAEGAVEQAGAEFNKGTPYGEPRLYSTVYAIVSPEGHLSSHHWIKAHIDGPSVKRGEWLIGERVTKDDATHILEHRLTVRLAPPATPVGAIAEGRE